MNEPEPEIWKTTEDGLYEVSNLGKMKLAIKRSNRQKGHLIKWQHNKDGYCKTVLVDAHGKPKSLLLHRIVASLFLDSSSDGKTVNHKNGDKDDNRASNLEYLTVTENIRHSFKTGLHQVKLTSEMLGEIPILKAQGCTDLEIGKKMGVARSHITRIRGGHRYGWAIPA